MSDTPTPTPAGDAGGDPAAQPRLNVNVTDEHKVGKYANFLVVTQSPHDFTLDFCQLLPTGDPNQVNAEVVSRIRIAPTMVARIIQALNRNLNAYEERWGNVRAIG